MNDWLSQGKRVFAVLVAALLIVVLVTLARLPGVVASHFDGRGAPNGWSSRLAYVLLLLLLGAGLPLGIVWLVHRFTRQGTDHLNLPYKDYWMRPDRRAEAVRRVRQHIWWLGCIMAGMALGIHWLILSANATQPPRLATAPFLVVLLGMVSAVAAWIAAFYRVLRPASFA